MNNTVTLGLNAALITVTDSIAKVLTVKDADHTLADKWQTQNLSLPFGPFDPTKDSTLHIGLHRWIKEQTGLVPNYVEQLYTFGNRFRDPGELEGGPRVISVGYLGLLPEQTTSSDTATWQPIYDFLPWEDFRQGANTLLKNHLLPALELWATEGPSPQEISKRQQRITLNFGAKGTLPNPERVLERYQILYEAGLVAEAHRDFQTLHGKTTNLPMSSRIGNLTDLQRIAKKTGTPMALDHRRILASALERIRGKLKYRPLVFELMPNIFTLFQLQKVVEALSGVNLHKQNFRRLVLNEQLVVETGRSDTTSRGRPAALYKFRKEVLHERPAQGVGLPKVAG